MILRYIVDIDIDEEDTEMEFALRDDIKDFVKDHEYGYMANRVDVKLQDNYCIKEERKLLSAGNKVLNKKRPIIKYGELHTTHNLGRLMSFHCPSCGKFIIAMYETDVERGGGIHKDLKGCSTCLQAIDFTGYYHIDKLDDEIDWSNKE